MVEVFVIVRYLYRYVLVDVFCFKQKTADEMRISDWSSDVCSSDLRAHLHRTLERCGGKGIVNHGGDPVRAGKIADEFDIDHIERGIGRRFEEEHRSEERRVGQECDSTWRSRRSTNHK